MFRSMSFITSVAMTLGAGFAAAESPALRTLDAEVQALQADVLELSDELATLREDVSSIPGAIQVFDSERNRIGPFVKSPVDFNLFNSPSLTTYFILSDKDFLFQVGIRDGFMTRNVGTYNGNFFQGPNCTGQAYAQNTRQLGGFKVMRLEPAHHIP
jgi:hypothetical protein